MRGFQEEEAVNCMMVKFKYKTSLGWDALKKDTFPVSAERPEGGWGKWDQTLCEG